MNNIEIDYYRKYLKYKTKYLELIDILEGGGGKGAKMRRHLNKHKKKLKKHDDETEKYEQEYKHPNTTDDRKREIETLRDQRQKERNIYETEINNLEQKLIEQQQIVKNLESQNKQNLQIQINQQIRGLHTSI